MVFQPGITQPTIDQPPANAQPAVTFISVIAPVPLFPRQFQYQVQTEPVAPVVAQFTAFGFIQTSNEMPPGYWRGEILGY